MIYKIDFKTDYNNWVPENSSEINFLFEVLGSTVTDYHNPSSACKAHIGETGNADDIKGLINFVRGQDYFDYDGDCDLTETRDNPLGDIYHSELVTVGAPNAETGFTGKSQEAYFRSINNYDTWAASKSNREEIIYVGHQNPVKRNLTVEENLLFWVKLIGEHREKESVDKALSTFLPRT